MPWEHDEKEIDSAWISKERPFREGGREDGICYGTEDGTDTYHV